MSFKSGVILILLSAAAWGLGGVCGQYLYQFHAVTAPWLIAVRQVLAGLIFLGYLLLRGENIFRIFADKRDAKDQLAFSFLGLLGAPVWLLLYNFAVQCGDGDRFAIHIAGVCNAVDEL